MDHIKFANQDHKAFFLQRISETTNDEYHRAFWYAIGLTDTTRRNYKTLYDFKNKRVITNSLEEAWQTSSSARVTRLAFNLYNGWVYNSEDDFQNSRVSKYFAVDEIFCDSLAPYFYEAICLRYPDYTQF